MINLNEYTMLKMTAAAARHISYFYSVHIMPNNSADYSYSAK